MKHIITGNITIVKDGKKYTKGDAVELDAREAHSLKAHVVNPEAQKKKEKEIDKKIEENKELAKEIKAKSIKKIEEKKAKIASLKVGKKKKAPKIEEE